MSADFDAPGGADGGSAQARREAADACLRVAAGGMQLASEAVPILAMLGFEDRAAEVAGSVYLGRPGFAFDRARQLPAAPRYPQHGEAYPHYLFRPLLAGLRRAGRLGAVFDGVGLTAFWRATAPVDV